MYIISPTKFNIISNNAKNSNIPEYSSQTTYKRGDEVNYENDIYKATKETTNENPKNEIFTWVKIGKDNKYKFLDEYINTQTVGDKSLKVQIDFLEYVDTFAFFNTKCQKIRIKHNQKEIFNKKMQQRKNSLNWFNYFFEFEALELKDFWFLNPFVIKKGFEFELVSEEDVALGGFLAGKKVFLGNTLVTPKISLIDYSKVITDEWGNSFFRKGKTTKYASVSVAIENSRIDFIRNELEKIVGTPTLFLCDQRDDGYESLNIFGSFSDFDIIIENGTHSQMNLTIKGVI